MIFFYLLTLIHKTNIELYNIIQYNISVTFKKGK